MLPIKRTIASASCLAAHALRRTFACLDPPSSAPLAPFARSPLSTPRRALQAHGLPPRAPAATQPVPPALRARCPPLLAPFPPQLACLAPLALSAPWALLTPRSAPKGSFQQPALPAAHPALLAPSLLPLALHCVNHALVATSALLAPRPGLVSIAGAATTAPAALALQRPAPFKCPQLADGALCKSKALRSSWKQPRA